MQEGLSEKSVQPLLRWFEGAQRILPWRETPTPYRVWISEIMLQQTRVQAVLPYFERFLNALPTISALAEVSEEQLLKLWEGLGYYSRARNLRRAAQIVCERWAGELPADYDALRLLPGIGEYTAGAIASIAFQIAVPAVDGNVLRIAARLDNDFTPITLPAQKRTLSQKIMSMLPKECPGDFNQALMELGATVCLPNGAPRCGECPLRQNCCALSLGTVSALPVKEKKPARRIEEKTVLVVRFGNCFGIQKRPNNGLLAGMWELPSIQGSPSPKTLRRMLKQQGWDISKILSLRPAKHIFTHIEWHMSGIYIELNHPAPALVFATMEEIDRKYALPSAFRAFRKLMEELS